MERFRFIRDHADEFTFDELQNVISHMVFDTCFEFNDMTPYEIQTFILEGNYVEKTMEADICTAEENKHVWSFKNCEQKPCFVCLNEVSVGWVCAKCLMTVHTDCYSSAGECEIKYYDKTMACSIPHAYSNKKIDERCDECHQKMSRFRVGQICRWCQKKIHIDCYDETDQCVHSSLRFHIYFPIYGCIKELDAKNLSPLLVFINVEPNNKHAEELAEQFHELLHPMQVVNINFSDPVASFLRFAVAMNFIAMTIGSDRISSYVVKGFDQVQTLFHERPKFRFIPLGPLAVVGRTYGGRINYATKSAEYYIRQLPRLETIEVAHWTIQEIADMPEEYKFRQKFISSFVFNMKTCVGMAFETSKTFRQVVMDKLADSCVSCSSPPPEPAEGQKADAILTLELDGKVVDIASRRFIAIALLNMSLKGVDETNRKVAVYGLTKYVKPTKRNFEESGIKLAETADVKIRILDTCPFLADGCCSDITDILPGQWKELHLRTDRTIKILSGPDAYAKEDGVLLEEDRGECEDGRLDESEEVMAKLEKELQKQGVPEDREPTEAEKNEKELIAQMMAEKVLELGITNQKEIRDLQITET